MTAASERLSNIGRVISFGLKVKARMQKLSKTRVRVECPEQHADSAQHYVTAILAGRKQHIHMACDDAACSMRMME